MRKKLRCVKVRLAFSKTVSLVTRGRKLDFGVRFWRTPRAKENSIGVKRTIWCAKTGRRCARPWFGILECMITSCVGRSLKWKQSELLKFAAEYGGGSKRYKSSSSSSFNTESVEASINLNTNVGDNDEDEVQEIRRLMGNDKVRDVAKKKWVKSIGINQDQSMEMASGKLVTPFEILSDDVWKIVTLSGSAVIKEALKTLAWRRHLDYLRHNGVMLIKLIKDNDDLSEEDLDENDDIMKTPLEPRKDYKSPSGINNFTGRVRGMPIFIGNFTYVSDFMIVEDISSVIDPRLSPVVLGKPFVELFDMTCDLSLGMPIEQYDLLSDMEK
ncbi:hypothetical protein Tco_0184672 [Tanacetum coccineum]